jgi:DNA polymerase-3 subunit epsilon
VRCADCRGGISVAVGSKTATTPSPRFEVRVAAPQSFGPPPPAWRQSSADSDWVAVDLETTGFLPRTDRVIEIGLVRFDRNGRELDAWTTLLDPMRDMGATHVHGITSRDVAGAPKFREVAGEVLAWISDTRLVAHNSRFDLGFLTAEFDRAGRPIGEADAFCTMSVPFEHGVVENRRLAECCAELGIAMDSHHVAVSDARATGQILFRTAERLGRWPYLPAIAPSWPQVPPPHQAPRRRGSPAPLSEGSLGSLAAQVGVPEGMEVSTEVALSYLDLLDRVLEDRRLTPDEISNLGLAAREWGVGRDDAERLHRAYVAGIGELALADGVVTPAERADLARLNELLGLGPAARGSVPEIRAGHRSENFVGKSVCFTGESVCTMAGQPLSRSDQERFAAEAGLVIKSGVSGVLDLLVLADPDSMSGKARKAAELGVRRIAEPVFWRSIGLEID